MSVVPRDRLSPNGVGRNESKKERIKRRKKKKKGQRERKAKLN